MILNLQIKNFILIEQLDLNFDTGYTVITGESGSGKSMILQALVAVCGGKLKNASNSSIVQSGYSKAILTAELLLTDQNVKAKSLLTTNDLISDEDNTAIIKRVINCDGKSKFYVNDNLVSLNLVKKLTNELISFTSQYAHIQWLSPNTQQQFIDSYISNQQPNFINTLLQLKQAYQHLLQLQQQITNFNNQSQQYQTQKTYLQEKIISCQGLDINADDYKQLEKEHEILNNSEYLQQELTNLYQLLENSDQLNLYLKSIYQTVNKLKNLSPQGLELDDYSNNIKTNFNQLKSVIQQQLYQINHSQNRLNELDKIIANTYEVTKKYQISQPQIKEMLKLWQQQLEQIPTTDIDSLRQEEQTIKNGYYMLAQKISELRLSFANKIANKITTLLPTVALTGQFEIKLTNQDPNSSGIDQIQFMINNHGKSQNISDSISGGELARISLLLNYVLNYNYDTTLFDEIDVGISGSTASSVGKLLLATANNKLHPKQVICITHQAQTASFATHHLLVTRCCHNISAKYLNQEEKIKELARILSGENITATGLKHAQELINSSQSNIGK